MWRATGPDSRPHFPHGRSTFRAFVTPVTSGDYEAAAACVEQLWMA